MAGRAAARREVMEFDAGDLWCDGDASPPTSPAGWYFRIARPGAAWVGPFASAEGAEAAPSSGDGLRDARRRLEIWARDGLIENERAAAPAQPADRPTPLNDPVVQVVATIPDALAGGEVSSDTPADLSAADVEPAASATAAQLTLDIAGDARPPVQAAKRRKQRSDDDSRQLGLAL